ncbi:MAG: protein kinase [Deltaproteobacteria bacterium]|jgi:serine/threonine protein kinase|nr:protein kinase [Deltaproteobacteria bacterium]MBW2535027.1 protein kinase [Deltaproteobacteria bacterium]
MGRDDAADSGQAFGRYQLLEHLGRGGMADVYKAKSFGVEGFEKVLVIKRIVPDLALHDEFVQMFVQEAKLAVRLSHANIVQVFDLGRIDTGPDEPPSYFIAMEYVDGVDLATVLKQLRRDEQPMPLGLAVFVAAEIAKALDHAHRRRDEDGDALGIVHRDISPHNVLLSWDGDVKVTDFGIAKAQETITRDEVQSELEVGRAAGKIAYLSPEQSRAQLTDARSDLFSLGVVLYEMIGGANPFAAPTSTETIRRIGVVEYPPLNLVRPDAPDALVEILDQLLTARPEERIGTAAELGERLLSFAYDSGIRVGPADLALLLEPLRKRPDTPELEAASVLAEPTPADDKTPVEIPHSGLPTPVVDSISESGERREVTALVLSFGARAADLPEALLARARTVLDRHGARIEQETGEQIAALFGLGDTDGRDVDAAVRAALVLVRERHADAIPSAGVHCGPVAIDAAGAPVEDERFSGLMTAAQALARATEGHVALSPLAARMVRRNYLLDALPESGRALPDGGYVVRSAHVVETPPTKFVGRVNELRQLGAILAATTRRTPQIVVITGETGIGKTRLLAETKRRLERGQFNVAFYSANCPLNGAQVPWSGLRAMLHVLCGTQEDDAPGRILEVRPRLRALGLSDGEAAAVLQLLGAPVQVTETDPRSLLRAAFGRMVRSLCKDRVQCLAWDDAQSLDRDTLEVLLGVLRYEGGLRAAVVLAQRSEVPEPLVGHKALHAVSLDELSESDTARFVEQLLDARSVPMELLRYVRSCAGGHPLFLEELLRDLTDSGAVRMLGGRVELGEEGSTPPTAPRTLRTLVASRVSRLDNEQRRVLQAVAILGVPAFTPVLAAVLERPMTTLDRLLSSLNAKGLLRRTGPTKVRFASPLYREIVLDAMKPETRSRLHSRAAATYQQAGFSPTGGTTAERVAHHLFEAGERRAAVDFFWQSAEQKLEHGQREPAVRTMIRALGLADLGSRSVGELVGWLATLSKTVSQVRAAPGLRDAALAVLREVESRGDERQRFSAHVDVARALGAVNLFEEAYDVLEAVDVAAEADVDLKRAALIAEIIISVRQGLFVRAASAADRLEELGPIDDPLTMLAVSQARGSTGQPELGLRLLDQLDQQWAPKDAAEAVMRRKHRCLISFSARDYAGAAREARQGARLARAVWLRYETAVALHNLADALIRLEDHPRAYAALTESLDLTRLLEHERLTALNQMYLSYLDGLRDVEGATDRLKSLIRYADGHGYLWDVLEGRFLLARLALFRDEADEARGYLEQVVGMAEDQGHEVIAIEARELLAELTQA